MPVLGVVVILVSLTYILTPHAIRTNIYVLFPSRQVFSISDSRVVRCNDAGTICVTTTQYSQPGYTAGKIYRSVDSGVTWSAVPGTDKGIWGDVWCNPAGTMWYAALRSQGFGTWGAIYKSTDSGASFSLVPGSDQGIARWEFVACDASGMKCVGGGNFSPSTTGLHPYTTNDGWATYNEITTLPYGIYLGATVSSDGSTMVLSQYENWGMDNNGYDLGTIYHSDDGGATFTATGAPLRYYYGVVCDAAMMNCLASASSDENYDPVLAVQSCTGGRSWYENPGPAKEWYAIKIDADGRTMWAGDNTWQQTKYIWSFPLPVA